MDGALLKEQNQSQSNIKDIVTSPIVINMPNKELLARKTKNYFVERFEHLNSKNMFVNKYLRFRIA